MEPPPSQQCTRSRALYEFHSQPALSRTCLLNSLFRLQIGVSYWLSGFLIPPAGNKYLSLTGIEPVSSTWKDDVLTTGRKGPKRNSSYATQLIYWRRRISNLRWRKIGSCPTDFALRFRRSNHKLVPFFLKEDSLRAQYLNSTHLLTNKKGGERQPFSMISLRLFWIFFFWGVAYYHQVLDTDQPSLLLKLNIILIAVE